MPARPKARQKPRPKPGEIVGASMRISPPQPVPLTPRMRTGANMRLSTAARRRHARRAKR